MPVSEAAVQDALAAVAPFWKEAHAILQAYPSAQLARAMLEAAAPRIAAERAERAERAEAQRDRIRESSARALTRVAAGIAEQRERAEAAEERLAGIRSVLLEGGQADATARRRALGIIGGGEEADHV